MKAVNEAIVAAASATQQPLWVIDSSGRCLFESPTWCDFTGQSWTQARDGGWLEAVLDEDRSAVRALFGSRNRAAVECRVLRPNGRHTRIRVTAAPIADSDLFVCTLSEVWADESVRRSEERLRLATEAANVAVWEYDFVAGQMSRTDNHDRLYGFEPLKVWTIDVFTSATHPEDRAASSEIVARSVAPGGPDHYEMDFRVVWPDGSVHWLACIGDVLRRDAEGRATIVRGTLADVTRLKNIEAQLREAVRARDEFLQVASHELNTPLTPLLLKLDRLSARAQREGGKDADDLAAIKRHVKRLAHLIEELLDVTRLSEGRVQLELSEVPLVATVKSVIEQLSANVAAASAIQLDAPAEVVGRWDRTRIEQITENLISNAQKYGRGRPVRVSIRTVGERVELEVADEGIGIEPEALPRIFDRFERAPSARNFGGLGLGLYIVKQVVEQHHGRIHAVSEVGKGSTFTVSLPVK